MSALALEYSTEKINNERNWVVLNKEDGESFFSLPILLCFGGLSVIILIAMMCGVYRLCRREGPDYTTAAGQPHYSVAISNSLFKEGGNRGEMPCLNCRLIEMGEMACYQDRCPQCNRVPPCKSAARQDSIQGSTGRWGRGGDRDDRAPQVFVNPGHGASDARGHPPGARYSGHHRDQRDYQEYDRRTRRGEVPV